MTDQFTVLLLASGFSLVVLGGRWAWGMRHEKDISVHIGFFVVANRSPDPAWTSVSPLPVYCLLRFGSGVRMTDRMMLQKRKGDPEYFAYLGRTSGLLCDHRCRIDTAQDVR